MRRFTLRNDSKNFLRRSICSESLGQPTPFMINKALVGPASSSDYLKTMIMTIIFWTHRPLNDKYYSYSSRLYYQCNSVKVDIHGLRAQA